MFAVLRGCAPAILARSVLVSLPMVWVRSFRFLPLCLVMEAKRGRSCQVSLKSYGLCRPARLLCQQTLERHVDAALHHPHDRVDLVDRDLEAAGELGAHAGAQ